MTVQNDKLWALLLEEQDRLHARVAKFEANLDALTRARRSESDDDEHDPEGEPLSAQWSMRVGLLESARAEAALADSAVKRFEAGDYGICVTCLQPIPEGQLEARPIRKQCVACVS